MVHGQRIKVARATAPARDAFDLWLIRLAAAVDAAATWIVAYRRYRQECKQLLALDDRQLRDIGISRVDAFAAANQPFRRRF